MASKLADTTAEHTKYGRLCRMVVELCRDMLWELLTSKIPINELPEKVHRNLHKLCLNSAQLRCICKPGRDLPSNIDVDISILYTILRNICPKIKAPTHGWFDTDKGNRPTRKDVKVGDDIERIHLKRNALYGHAKEARVDAKTYNDEVADIRAIASRMDSRLNTKFTKFLNNLEECSMDPDMENEYIEHLLKQKEREEVMEERIEKVEGRIEKIEENQRRELGAVEQSNGSGDQDDVVNGLRSGEGIGAARTTELDSSTVTSAPVAPHTTTNIGGQGSLNVFPGGEVNFGAGSMITIETSKEVKESQARLTDEVKEVKAKARVQEDHVQNLQEVCADTADKVETLKKDKDSQAQNVDQLTEKVKNLETDSKKPATTINITQQHIRSASTSEVKVQSNISNLCELGLPEVSTATDSEKDQPAKRSYSSAVTENLPDHQTMNVNVTNVNINYGSTDGSLDENQKGKFLSLTNNFDEGHFILVTSDVKREKCLEELALVPWTAVFDFDPNSRTTGLLSVVEPKIPELTNRSVHINCIEDYNVTKITESSTHWMFCNGYRENSKSGFTDIEWQENPQLKSGIKSFMNQLKEYSLSYTNYTIVILWPSDDSAITAMYHLVQKMQKLKGQLVIVDSNQSISEDSKSFQNVLSTVNKKNYSKVNLKLEELCKTVSLCQAGKFDFRQSPYQLPTADNTNMIDITDKEAAWLEEDLHILYLNNRCEPGKFTTKKLRKECDEFYKGGTLPWDMWYEVGPGHVDANRDCMDDLMKLLKKEYIQQGNYGIVTLYHAPGSGGTTLAQRTLWEFRKLIPCVQVKLRSNATLNDIVQRLDFLRNKTSRQLLVLFDGEDNQKVCTYLPYVRKIGVVVLNLQRYPHPMKSRSYSPTTFWLPNTLSAKEAKVFALKFQGQCSEKEKIKTIDDMADAVRFGTKISIFEFGLAAYDYHFKGIEKYVKGYLNLQSSKDTLQPWQTALGMLSLTYFYGQFGLPCQFFADMLGKTSGRSISVEDFPDDMQSLIVLDTMEKRKNIIRISNYYVAKEILEQILPWPNPRCDKRLETLSTGDRNMLKTFAIKFIKEVERVDKGQHGVFNVLILAKTFIFRHSRHEQNDLESREKKTKQLSQIFQDLSAKAPHSQRFEVMEQLCKSFPKDPHFRAHLGRLHSIFNPENEMAAEQCFIHALALCGELSPHQRVEDMPHGVRSTCTITHSMYADMFRRRIARYAGWNFTQNKPKIPTNEGQFEQHANKLVEMVKEGRKHFQKWRVYEPDETGIQNSFLGEIHICLMFCDFICKRGGHPDIAQFIDENDSKSSELAEECIYLIEERFLEFFSTVEHDDEVDDQVVNLQHWNNALFKNNMPFPGSVKIKNAHSKRLQIALLKLQNSKDSIHGVLENIQSQPDIENIVEAFEEIFKDVHEKGTEVSRSSLDQDYKEWLVAIRHDLLPDHYSVEHVLEQIQKWFKKFHTPLSKFYVFVLKSILGFGNLHSYGKTEMLIGAQRLKKDIIRQNKFMVTLKSRHSREWLGMGTSICQLVMSTRFYGQKEDHTNYVKPGSVDPKKLALMRGTIQHPNQDQNTGYISLDLGTENNVSVLVFFVPMKFDMHFKHFANEKVEFNLGFSYTYGYEADNVKRLQKLTCKKCQLPLYATSRDKTVECLTCCSVNAVVKRL